MSRNRPSRVVHETRALLLRRVILGESDLVVTFLTEHLGPVSAIARGARKSQRRFGGALEPMHTLRVRLTDAATHDLMVLEEATLDTARSALLTDLERLQAAGTALAWVRDAAAPRVREPALWTATVSLLDDLSGATSDPGARLAAYGLHMLVCCGWALDFERCVACSRPCPLGSSAEIDPQRGGLVCSRCGGAKTRLDASLRLRLLAAAGGDLQRLTPADAPVALALIETSFASHLGVRR